MMGLGGSGDRGDRDEDDEDDGIPPEQETIVDDSEDGSESDDSKEETAVGAAGGAVAGAAAGAGATGAGGAATGAAGAAAGGAAANTDDPTGSDKQGGDSTDDNASDDADESSEESSNEPDGERDEHDSDESNEREEREESEKDDDEDDDENEKENQAELVVYTDAWDATGWGIEPTLKRLDVEFGDNFDLSYEVLSPREIDHEQYDSAVERYDMPFANVEALPDDTVASSKALRVAKDLNPDLFRDYLRRLRIAALVEKRSIEEASTLVDLAGKVGFEREEFEKVMRETADQMTETITKTPVMNGSVGGQNILWSGNLEYGLAFGVLIDNNVSPGVPLTPTQFVSEYDPVPTVEATTALKIKEDQLSESGVIHKSQFGHADFWTPNRGSGEQN